MISQPNPEQRPAVLFFSAAGCLALAVMAVFVGTYIVEGASSEGSLHMVSMVCWELIILGMLLTCGTGFLVVWRGPVVRKPKTVIYSEDWLLSACLATIGVGTTGGALGMLDGMTRDGGTSGVLVWGIFAFIAALAVVGWISLGAVLWNSIRRGHSRLTLASNPVPAGQPMRAVLEIPFTSEAAPVVTLTLDLQRRESDVSNDMAPSQERVWSETLHLSRWEPAGPGRCCAEFEVALPAGQPCDLDERRVAYNWSLVAQPEHDSVAWNAHFTLPLEFAREAQEAQETPAAAMAG